MAELNVVKRLREIQKRITELSQKQVVVGAIGGGDRGDGLTNADLLAIHEFGAIIKHPSSDPNDEDDETIIPERPVLRVTLGNNKQVISSTLSKKVADCLRGDLSIDEAYSHVGIVVKNAVLDTFDSNNFTPNDPKTIKQKGSSKVLIDTGALRASINYEVRNSE